MTRMQHLAAVRLVLQDKFSTTANAPEIVGLIVSEFLVQDFPLDRCCQFGSLDLMEFQWERGIRDLHSSEWSIAKLLHAEPHYYQYIFSKSMAQSIRQGGIELVRWLLDHFSNCRIDVDILQVAAKGGQLQILQVLEQDQRHRFVSWDELRQMEVPLEEGIEWGNGLLNVAGNEGHWDVVHWLDEHMSTPETRTRNDVLVGAALQELNLEQVEWLIQNAFGCSWIEFPECTQEQWPRLAEIVHYLLEARGDLEIDFFYYAVDYGARFGDLELVKLQLRYIDEHGHGQGAEPILRALQSASKRGHLPVVQFLLSHLNERGFLHGPSSSMIAAVKGGQLGIVRTLYEQYGSSPGNDLFHADTRVLGAMIGFTPTTVMDIAASEGHLEVLQFLHGVVPRAQNKRKERSEDAPSVPKYCTTLAMDLAARFGHLDVVKWLHDNRSEGCTWKAMHNAASQCHLEVVQWLHQNRSEGCLPSTIDDVVQNCYAKQRIVKHRDSDTRCQHKPVVKDRDEKYMEVVQWLVSNRSEGCSFVAINTAAGNGALELLQLLHSVTSADRTGMPMDAAAAHGWFDVVKWLHKRQYGCTVNSIDGAAFYGHLEIMQWLYANRSEGCTEEAMVRAARCGYLEIIKWLHGNRLTGNSNRPILEAARHGHLKVVRWLMEHFSVVEEDAFPAIKEATSAGHFEIALFLHSLLPKNTASIQAEQHWRSYIDQHAGRNPINQDIRAWIEDHFLENTS